MINDPQTKLRFNAELDPADTRKLNWLRAVLTRAGAPMVPQRAILKMALSALVREVEKAMREDYLHATARDVARSRISEGDPFKGLPEYPDFSDPTQPIGPFSDYQKAAMEANKANLLTSLGNFSGYVPGRRAVPPLEETSHE